MAKSRRKVDTPDPRQMSLLDLLQRSAELRNASQDEGSLGVQPRLSNAMSAAIRRSGLSRWDIAGRMSHLVGQEITKEMLDAWTAESKQAWRPPAEFLPAFCAATGSREPLQIITDAAGLFCLPGPEALRAEIQKLREQERKVGAERRKREMFLQEMER